MVFKIITLNVRGIAERKKRRAIFNYYRQRADIICLQETHSIDEDEDIWTAEWNGLTFFSHGRRDSCGVCILISKNLGYKVNNVAKDREGRILCVEIQSYTDKEDKATICNIYAPNSDDPSFFTKILKISEDMCEQRVIIGDFNVVMDPELDRLNSTFNKQKSQEILQVMCDELMLCDIWRVRNTEKRQFSWFRREKTKTIASRIDFALVPLALAQKVENVMYIPGFRTDHSAYFLCINITGFERGRGYWKMNTRHLRDCDYIEIMNRTLDKKIAATSKMGRAERWEYIKKQVAKTSQEFAKNKASDINLIIAQLSEKIAVMEENIHQLNEADSKILLCSKIDLEEFMAQKMEGVMFRVKANWEELGERSSKFFFGLERSKAGAKTCTSLINDRNEQINDPKKILEYQRAYYKDLYAEEKDVKFNLNNDTNIKIPEAMRVQADTVFTKGEMAKAIKDLANNKTPGSDGIPIDWYKVFYTKIRDVLFEAIEESFEKGKLYPSALEGIINLIPKGQKDSRFLKFLRPITLLSADYKVIEKILANRMQPMLEEIINMDQKGFMKDRKIAANIRRVLDLMKYAEEKELEAIVLSLDFQKCFDRISFTAINGAMNYFDMPSYMIKWTEILYNGFRAKIQNAGHFSADIEIQRGVHQGGPCSAFYFLLCAEILAINIRSNEQIIGIPVNMIRNILGQYADDMDVYMLKDRVSYENVLHELDRFRKHSGFTLSYEKTTVYRIGSLRRTDFQFVTKYKIKWTNEPINVLGIWITDKQAQSNKLNYECIMAKVEAVYKGWARRKSSLTAKVMLINSLTASLFVYKMMVLPAPPKSILLHFQKLTEKFLWNGAKPKISYETLQRNKKQGGLQLVNLSMKSQALKTIWPAVLIKDNKLGNIVYQMIAPNLKHNLWRCEIDVKDVDEIIDKERYPFWSEVLKAWNEYKQTNRDLKQEVQMKLIWCNSKIKIGGRMVCWKKCIQNDLLYIGQLYKNGRALSCREAMVNFGLTLMEYNSLMVAIPREWRKEMNTSTAINFLEKEKVWWEKVVEEKKTVRKAYFNMQEKEYNYERKCTKWEVELEEKVSEQSLLEGFKELYITSNSPKLRSFQFRLLHRAVITNVHLKHWKMSDSELCTQCGKEKETYKHLFVMCERVQSFWVQIEQMMNDFNKERIDFSVKNVMWNQLIEADAKNVKNSICLMAKQYIYRQRCLKKEISYNEFKYIVYETKNIEKYIATKNNMLSKHEKKWEGRALIKINEALKKDSEN